MRVSQRCRHGFELTQVACPQGCGGAKPLAEQKSGPRVAAPHVVGPGFIDLLGQELSGVRVVARAANSNDGSAQWTVQYPCGCTAKYSTSKLRRNERRGHVMRCRWHDRRGKAGAAE